MTKTTDGIQSLERGLEVLRLLAARGAMSSLAIASELGIHQSSASRLLKSLRAAGLVRKPTFQSFAVGYGILHLAGIAMESFPIVPASVKVCSDLRTGTECGAAAGMLWENRIVYFARVLCNPDAAPVLVERSDFPVKDSALGLLLLYRHELGKNDDGNSRKALSAKVSKAIAGSLDKHGILYVENIHINRFAAAIEFEVDNLPSALVIHSRTLCISPSEAAKILKKARNELLALCRNHI
ncbi:MAG: helix-turn-helix domain-containing protein [Victivallaceae bacterium]|jgi:DNA-binding Lrp family transcriptional regulator